MLLTFLFCYFAHSAFAAQPFLSRLSKSAQLGLYLEDCLFKQPAGPFKDDQLRHFEARLSDRLTASNAPKKLQSIAQVIQGRFEWLKKVFIEAPEEQIWKLAVDVYKYSAVMSYVNERLLDEPRAEEIVAIIRSRPSPGVKRIKTWFTTVIIEEITIDLLHGIDLLFARANLVKTLSRAQVNFIMDRERLDKVDDDQLGNKRCLVFNLRIYLIRRHLEEFDASEQAIREVNNLLD